MLTVIKVTKLKNTSNGYEIRVNDELFIQATNPIMSAMDMINVLNSGRLFGNNVMIESEFDTNAKINMDLGNTNSQNEEIDFDKLNEEIGFGANTHAYRNTFFNTDTTIEDEPKENVNESTNDTVNEPVGNVECPEVGDLVYIDGQNGLLSTITGGVCTVSMIYKSEDPVVVDTIEHAVYNEEWDEEEEEIEEITENNILFEVDEFPGTYFSWTMLKDKQELLQLKYGYKPACKI